MTPTKQEVCKSCLGKKQESVFKGPIIASADFPGEKDYIIDKGGIKMVDCSRCKGTGLEPVYEKEIRYAIKCSTEEQARECEKKGYTYHINNTRHTNNEKRYYNDGYTIISYEEAKDKGLLENKKTTTKKVLLYEAGYNTAKVEMEEKIEKIMKDINKGRHSEGWSQGKLKSILEKHLSTKE